jgi:hypothetical protein
MAVIKGSALMNFRVIDVSQRSLMEIRQTDIIQQEFIVRAVIINFNGKEVPINPIIKSRTHYLSCQPLIHGNINGLMIQDTHTLCHHVLTQHV